MLSTSSFGQKCAEFVIGASISKSCVNEPSGSIVLTIENGVSPFVVKWNDGGGTYMSRTSLKAGKYTVSVKDSNGCTKTASFVVSNYPKIFINQLSNNNDIELKTKGGVNPLSVMWINSNGRMNNKSRFLNNPKTGTYIAIVSDANNCSETEKVIIE
jgi:hypothetical protein